MNEANPSNPPSGQMHDIKQLKSQKNRLAWENSQIQADLDQVTERIEAIREENLKLRAGIERYDNRSAEYRLRIDELQSQNNGLTNQVNRSRQSLKSVKSDEESSLLLTGTLIEELKALTNDKNDLGKRIKTLQQVIEELNEERKDKLPKLKRYDAMLKDAWYELQETESNMDVSLKLWQRKSSYKPVCE